MNKLETLEKSVRELYEQRTEGRDPWADWLYENHVFVVADYAEEVARNHGADVELARASAVLHDIADTEMYRMDDAHEERSLEIARSLMKNAGYDEVTIEIVVDDAIKFHSCKVGEAPSTDWGKAMSTADAMAHTLTDFYLFAAGTFVNRDGMDVLKKWALKKLDRDQFDKCQFEDVREQMRPSYEALKELFSR